MPTIGAEELFYGQWKIMVNFNEFNEKKMASNSMVEKLSFHLPVDRWTYVF